MEPGVLEEGGEAVGARAVELLLVALVMALEAVDADAVLGKDGVVRVGASVDPVVAREARLDPAVTDGQAVRRDFGPGDALALRDRRQRSL